MKVSEIKYNRFNVEKGIEEIKKIIEAVKNANSAEELLFFREESIKISKRAQSMNSLSYIRFTLNTQDKFYLEEKNYYDENMPALSALARDYNKAFLENKYSAEAFEKLNPNVRKLYELSVKIINDSIIDDLIKEAKLITEYDKLLSEMEFEFDGQIMPLSVLRKYFDDKNRSVRRNAMEIAGKTMQIEAEKFDALFDKLVKVRDKMAKKLKYDSYAQLGDGIMGRYSYGRKEINSFREAVVKYVVPVVVELKGKIAKNLNIKDFMLYDNECALKSGNPEPKGDAKELFCAAKKMYSEMSAETGKFFDEMLKAEAFDVFPKKGKWGGGYCTTIDEYKQPFILANFNGSSGDVDVLTHETGHALAFYEMFKNNNDYELNLGTMSIAEIHSMTMEFLAYPYAQYYFEDYESYKLVHLLSALTFIPYGCMVDEFQEICYDNPRLTPKERNQTWNDLEKKYRPYLSTKGITYFEKGTRWQYQMHIYESPMYYIDYCLSQMVAFEIFALSLTDYDSAFEKYMSILKKGGEKTFEKLVVEEKLGSPFDSKSVKNTIEKIKQEIENLMGKIIKC